MSQKMNFSLTLNGEKIEKSAYPMTRLLDFLREDCGQTGTKEGCGEGECGACSVLLDDELVNACLVPMHQVEGKEVVTIEGLAKGGVTHPVQQSFLECGGAQCGICTPGMIVASVALLRESPHPSEDEIKYGLSGNFCRCTGYMKIFDSVKDAAEKGGQI